MSRPTTLGELKQSEFAKTGARSVKDELRANLIRKLEREETIFPDIVGYEDTVVPQIINAILARHNFILLGLRGQAKSRILRGLTTLLDKEMPIVAGSEINDNPFAPLSAYGKRLIAEQGDNTPIDWVGRDSRYVEKLATPDVTIADILGDVDPIKAARGGHILSDELTIHYGLLPRANRGIFAINELPDLAGKIQVGLFNIMQEGDVQIKGYPVRLPLDIMLVFTANPEDYTARGKIITPLKDRIGSEIITHYPQTVDHGVTITSQEAWTKREGSRAEVIIPGFIRQVIEQIAFEARKDQRIDKRSGVSQRLPISVTENALSNAERRAIVNKETAVVPRISDIHAALPSITGKLELEYEGEQQGAEKIARELIRKAAGRIYDQYFHGANVNRIVEWFNGGNSLRVGELDSDRSSLHDFKSVPDLVETVTRSRTIDSSRPGLIISACELLLEGLYAQKKISRSRERGYTKADPEPAQKHTGRFGRGWDDLSGVN
ncbi:MAG TPA: magnesium chelatase [Blastocatellia bacterium]|nr:magnesium chelatase [Blastocatellia bacterium]